MRTNRSAAVAALAAAGLLAGCGGGGGASAPKAAQSATATTPQGLTATFAEDKAAVAVGGSVAYTLTLTNATSQPITYETPIGCGIDSSREGASVTIDDAAGTLAYPLPPYCGVIGDSQPATLAPGQSVSDTFSPVTGFSTPGTHSATATFAVLTPDATTQISVKAGPLTVNVQ